MGLKPHPVIDTCLATFLCNLQTLSHTLFLCFFKKHLRETISIICTHTGKKTSTNPRSVPLGDFSGCTECQHLARSFIGSSRALAAANTTWETEAVKQGGLCAGLESRIMRLHRAPQAWVPCRGRDPSSMEPNTPLCLFSPW